MAIELISTITAKNNGNFAIALSNEIKGGIHSKETIEDRDKISQSRLQEGMLCYVVSSKKYYQWEDNKWIEFSIGGSDNTQTSMYRVDTYDDMISINQLDLKNGTLCHVKDDEKGNFLYYFNNGEWCTIGTKYQVWIGVDEPPSKNYLWVDTRNLVSGDDITIENPPTFIDTPLVQHLVSQITSLNQKIIALQDQLEEIIKGNIDIGGGDDNKEEDAEKIESRFLTEEGDYFITEEWEYFLTEDSEKAEDNGSSTPTVKGTQFVTEDGNGFVTEDGNPIITEDS